MFSVFSFFFSSRLLEQIVAHVKARNLKVRWVLETHVHADHITGAQILRQHFPDVKLAIGAGVRKVQETFQPIFNLHELKCDGSQFDRLFEEGETLQVGAIKINVLFTPGMLEGTGLRRCRAKVFIFLCRTHGGFFVLCD